MEHKYRTGAVPQQRQGSTKASPVKCQRTPRRSPVQDEGCIKRGTKKLGLHQYLQHYDARHCLCCPKCRTNQCGAEDKAPPPSMPQGRKPKRRGPSECRFGRASVTSACCAEADQTVCAEADQTMSAKSACPTASTTKSTNPASRHTGSTPRAMPWKRPRSDPQTHRHKLRQRGVDGLAIDQGPLPAGPSHSELGALCVGCACRRPTSLGYRPKVAPREGR